MNQNLELTTADHFQKIKGWVEYAASCKGLGLIREFSVTVDDCRIFRTTLEFKVEKKQYSVVIGEVNFTMRSYKFLPGAELLKLIKTAGVRIPFEAMEIFPINEMAAKKKLAELINHEYDSLQRAVAAKRDVEYSHGKQLGLIWIMAGSSHLPTSLSLDEIKAKLEKERDDVQVSLAQTKTVYEVAEAGLEADTLFKAVDKAKGHRDGLQMLIDQISSMKF